ncbi:MAG TPA: DnaJ domain-containing protein [Dokdonella sp.]
MRDRCGTDMAGETDFISLYEQLGLGPDCSADELKRAYRRRIAELHPDRRPGPSDPAATARLQTLIAAYNAAIGFERRHGRLPGAALVRRGASMPPRTAAARPHAARGPAPAAPRRGTGLRWIVLAGLAAAGVGAYLWSGSDAEPPRRPPSSRTAEPPPRAPSGSAPGPARSAPATGGALPTGAPVLRLGMDADDVRAIQGRPVMVNGERWEYGPSWIEFDHGKVSGWYSSQLRPLKVAGEHTRPAEAR